MMDFFDSDREDAYISSTDDELDDFLQMMVLLGGLLGTNSGPPPASLDAINNLSDAIITEEQIRESLRCSICLEDFQVSELVKCLPCTHEYHRSCIEQWLKQHGTCPVCRRKLEAQASDSSNGEHEDTDEAIRGDRNRRTLYREAAGRNAGESGNHYERSLFSFEEEQPRRVRDVHETRRNERPPLRETQSLQSRWRDHFADDEREMLSSIRASRSNAHWRLQPQNTSRPSGSAVRAPLSTPIGPVVRDGPSAAAAGVAVSRAGNRHGNRNRNRNRLFAISSSDASSRQLHGSSPATMAPRPFAAPTARSRVSGGSPNQRSPSHSQQSASQVRGDAEFEVDERERDTASRAREPEHVTYAHIVRASRRETAGAPASDPRNARADPPHYDPIGGRPSHANSAESNSSRATHARPPRARGEQREPFSPSFFLQEHHSNNAASSSTISGRSAEYIATASIASTVPVPSAVPAAAPSSASGRCSTFKLNPHAREFVPRSHVAAQAAAQTASRSTSDQLPATAGHSHYVPFVAQPEGTGASYRLTAPNDSGLGAAPIQSIRSAASQEPSFGFGFGFAAAATATPASMYNVMSSGVASTQRSPVAPATRLAGAPLIANATPSNNRVLNAHEISLPYQYHY